MANDKTTNDTCQHIIYTRHCTEVSEHNKSWDYNMHMQTDFAERTTNKCDDECISGNKVCSTVQHCSTFTSAHADMNDNKAKHDEHHNLSADYKPLYRKQINSSNDLLELKCSKQRKLDICRSLLSENEESMNQINHDVYDSGTILSSKDKPFIDRSLTISPAIRKAQFFFQNLQDTNRLYQTNYINESIEVLDDNDGNISGPYIQLDLQIGIFDVNSEEAVAKLQRNGIEIADSHFDFDREEIEKCPPWVPLISPKELQSCLPIHSLVEPSENPGIQEM